MDSPFIYNRPVTGRWFTGRKNEVALLSNFLRDGENVAIYEPPKTGKDSLIQQVLFDMKLDGRQFRAVRVSLLNVRSISDFCLRLGSGIMKAVGSTDSDFASLAADTLGGTYFIFDTREWQDGGKVLSMNWDLDDDDITAMITLPYRVARRCGVRLFICLDEFQNVMLTEDGDKLCAIMQQVFKARTAEDRQVASYLLCGSQFNAMKEIFEHRKLFYRQVERVALEEIDSKDIADAVNRGFQSSGKVIERSLLLGVCELFRNNVHYINLFASVCDSISKGYMNESVLKEALASMIAVQEPRFRAIMSDLTTFQVNLLRAVVEGHTRFSSSEVIKRYNLNSSANVRRLKDALCKKEILSFDSEDRPVIIDPFFEYWVTKYYFEIQ